MNATSLRLSLLCGMLAIAGCSRSGNPVSPVTVPPLSALSVSPAADTLSVGGTATFTATALDTLGHPYTGGGLAWTSSDAGVVTVTSAGVVTARGEGLAAVVVSGGGRRDTARVLVLPSESGWLAQTSNATEDLQGVFFDPPGRLGWAVGKGGVVLATGDAGATWTRRTPTTFDLNGVWFTSATRGWVVGASGTVLLTVNGGLAWTRLANTATGAELRGVSFASADTGWAVGAGGLLMTTFDGGATWLKSFVGGTTLNEVRFVGADGWAAGEGGVLVGSHDRGRTWFLVQPAVTTQALRGLWRWSADRAVAVGVGGAVARTVVTADSVAWTLDTAGASNTLESVCFPAAPLGYAAGWNASGGLVLRSGDGGATWNPQVVSSQFHLNAVYFVDALRGWAVGENGTIRHTASGGE
jgi:photosystem II stability/assembly factor-like uncharacterized protein